MNRFKLAHLREQGQDMLIFPLDPNVHHKTNAEKEEILDELEWRAHAAGLAGHAVIVWEYGRRFYFLGPQLWQGFLRSLNMRLVLANVNREISWQD